MASVFRSDFSIGETIGWTIGFIGECVEKKWWWVTFGGGGYGKSRGKNASLAKVTSNTLYPGSHNGGGSSVPAWHLRRFPASWAAELLNHLSIYRSIPSICHIRAYCVRAQQNQNPINLRPPSDPWLPIPSIVWVVSDGPTKTLGPTGAFHADLALKKFPYVAFTSDILQLSIWIRSSLPWKEFDQWTKDLSSCRFLYTQVPARQTPSFPSECYNYQIPP